jgi:hypothetical protein
MTSINALTEAWSGGVDKIAHFVIQSGGLRN